jgi:hypothetical protein
MFGAFVVVVASCFGRLISAPKDGNETFQQVLTMLQDPLIPVRAHGLGCLRQLIVKRFALFWHDNATT